MISWCESEGRATEIPDEAVLDVSCGQSVRPYADNDRQNGTCILRTEDEKFTNESISSNDKLLLKEPCSSIQEEDHVERIKEFQFYVDMVKKIARPGCSPETLNVALSSMSSLLTTLSGISSLQYMHSSL